MNQPKRYASPEQLRYAGVLGAVVRGGFVLLVITFVLYLSGLAPPQVPVEQLPRYWSLPVGEFVRATHTPTGWAWLAALGRGDMLNMLGIAILAAASVFSTLAVLPAFARGRQTALLAIALLQLVVLAVSASNLLPAR
jgi:hypothetical protein